MSVETRRWAAAQRTAAASPRRGLRLASWFLIVPILSAFSFSVVAGAAGFGSKPDYAGAAEAVLPHGHAEHPGALVVVQAGTNDNGNPISRLFSSGAGREVCWIGSSQLARVSQRYSTGRMAITVNGKTLDLVTVRDATEPDLRTLLGPNALSCHMVRLATMFFLPFDAHGS